MIYRKSILKYIGAFKITGCTPLYMFDNLVKNKIYISDRADTHLGILYYYIDYGSDALWYSTDNFRVLNSRDFIMEKYNLI